MKLFEQTQEDNIIDPTKTNLAKNNKERAKELFEQNQAMKQDMVDERMVSHLEEEQKAMGADPQIAETGPASRIYNQRDEYRGAHEMSTATIGSGNDISLEDLDRSWLGEFQKSFTRGLGGQVIEGTGDMINFFVSALPGFTMKEGNWVGNALQDWGSDIEEANRTQIADWLKEKDVTWGSLANPEFWSVHIAETIPMMLEFLAMGKGFATLGAKTARGVAMGLGKTPRVGKSLLKKATDTTRDNAKGILSGADDIYDITGSGKGVAGKLFRNVDDTLEATQGFQRGAGIVSAGINQNMMAGAMNGMELHKEMTAENERAIELGEPPVYTDEEMARAAAGTFTNNLAYIGADMASWAITFGGVGKQLSQGYSKSVKPLGEMLTQSSGKFAARMMPVGKSLTQAAVKAGSKGAGKLGTVARVGAFEGIEESFQETFEEWAKMKAKEGAGFTDMFTDIPEYWDYYMSDKSRATRIIAGVSGGLFGGAMNLGTIFNKAANEEYSLLDRNSVLRAKIKIGDKLGREANQWAIENTLFDIAYNGKDEEVASGLIQDQIDKGNLTREQADEFINDYQEVQRIISATEGLNVKGAHTLAKNMFDKKRTERQLARLTEEQKAEEVNLKEFYGDDEVLYAEAVKRVGEQTTEKQNALAIKMAYLQANMENIMSGKKATMVADHFVFNKNGKEFHLAPQQIEEGVDLFGSQETDLDLDNGFAVMGLSEEMYNEFYNMSDQELFERAKKENAEAVKKMPSKVKGWYNKIKDKIFGKKEESGSETESEFVFNEEAALAEEQESLRTAEPELTEEQILEKAKENVAKRKAQAQEAFNKEQEAKKKASEQASTESGTETTPESKTPSKGEKTAKSESRKENESDFEREAIDSEEEVAGETLAEQRARRAKEIEEEFKSKKREKDAGVDNEEDAVQAKEQPKIVKDGNTFKIQTGTDSEGNPEYLKLKGKERVFQTEERANEVLNEQNKKAPDKKTDTKSESKKSGKALKAPAGFDPSTGQFVTQEGQTAFEQHTAGLNYRMHEIRQAIVRHNLSKVPYGARSEQNKNTPVLTQNLVNEYLDSMIGKWTFGPTVGQKARALNRYYEAAGIQMDVVDFLNLKEAIGIDALGYTLGKTVFIDEKAWEQDYVMMHEGAHVLYRTMKNTPVAKAVIQLGYRDKALIDHIKSLYAAPNDPDNLLIYAFENESGDIYFEGTLQEYNDYIGAGGIEFTKIGVLPDSEQAYINEEVFTHVLQGPLAKRLGSDFQLKQELESERRKTAMTFWEYIKGASTKKENGFDNVIKALNNGKPVPQDQLYDFVAKGFAEGLKGNADAYTTKGFAMRVMVNKKAKDEAVKKINEETNRQIEMFSMEEFKKKHTEQRMKDLKNAIRKNTEQYGEAKGWTKEEIDFESERRLEEFEDAMYDEGVFDDQELTSLMRVKGATRTLRNFVRSYNYVQRQRSIKNKKPLGELLDTEFLVGEMYNLAAETRGNTGEFIHTIQNSEVVEVKAFYDYMKKTYPDSYMQVMNEMGYLMGNQRVIQAKKKYTDKNGKTITENALSETENYLSENRFRRIKETADSYKFNPGNMSEDSRNQYNDFVESMKAIQFANPDPKHYITILKYLAPYSIPVDKIIEDGYLNWKGRKMSVEVVLNSYVRASNPDKRSYRNFYADGNPHIKEDTKSVINAIVDTGRQFMSRSTVVNAEGNPTSARITSNLAITRVDAMIDFLNTKIKGRYPSFQQFKKEFQYSLPATRRNVENPVLRMIYDNAMSRKSLPALSQDVGHKNDRTGTTTMFKNSDALTETLNDFLEFNDGVTGDNRGPNEYAQNMGAMGDSPRKFFITAPKHRADKIFNSEGKLSMEGRKLLRTSYEIYKGLNQSTPDNILSYEQYENDFRKSIQDLRKTFESHGNTLRQNESFKRYFDDKGKLNKEGKRAVDEYAFNTTVNRTAIAEIFTPGIPTKDITKRNKGVVAPVMSFGNPNLKMNFLYVNDKGNSEKSTDSHMYTSERSGKKIQNAASVLFPTGEAFKMLNNTIEDNNQNFDGRTAQFKGHTTMVTRNNVNGSEKGMRGLNALLEYQEDMLDEKLGELSDNLMDGSVNALTMVIPSSSIKSDFLTEKQKEKYEWITYDFIRDAYDAHVDYLVKNGIMKPGGDVFGHPIQEGSDWDKLMKSYEEINRDADGNFVGLSTSNFGLQQVMDKETNKSLTPVQLISSVISSASTNGILPQAERIQSLIREEMNDQLQEIKRALDSVDKSKRKELLLSYFDLEAMDQSQVHMLMRDLDMLDHPNLDAFVNSSLANILKVAGNKLKTNGALLQQKPDFFYENPTSKNLVDENGNPVAYYTGEAGQRSNKLKGITDRQIETTVGSRTGSSLWEMVVPSSKIYDKKNNPKGVKKREYLEVGSPELLYHLNDSQFKNLKKEYDKASTPEEKLEITKQVALRLANERHPAHSDQFGYGFKNSDHIGAFYDKEGNTLGYFVRGDYVLGTRIPSHGPSMTGAFEIVDEITGPGNNTIVPEGFTKIAGSDFDGDQLFVQWKGKDTPKFNQALDETVRLWSSPEMYSMIREEIDMDGDIKKQIEGIIKLLPASENESALPFSPQWGMHEFNNTMITKRSIGQIFNVHRLANYLSAYETKIGKPISIKGKGDSNSFEATGFEDMQLDGKSRTIRSAVLANIILDNSKWAYADKLGLNDQTLGAFALLTNMNFNLRDIALIMNSKGAKSYVNHMRDNNSPFLNRKRSGEVKNAIYNELGIKQTRDEVYNIDVNQDLNDSKNTKKVVDLLFYLQEVNNEISSLNSIMKGHQGIDNNPFVLENQLKDFNELLNNEKEGQVLSFNESFRNNPDVKGYQNTAKTSLEYLKDMNRIYSASTSKIINSLRDKISPFGEINDNQLKRASTVFNNFYLSRLLGLNNMTTEQKMKAKEDLMKDLADYLDAFKAAGKRIEDSILFSRALNINFSQKLQSGEFGEAYVKANPKFFGGDNSVTDTEIDALQREFEELPESIKRNMLITDLIDTGYQGTTSLTRVFDGYVNELLAVDSSNQKNNSDKALPKNVEQELMNIVVANEFQSPDSNIYSVTTPVQINADNIFNVFQGRGIQERLKQDQPFYLKINGSPYYFEGVGRGRRASESEAELKATIVSKLKPIKLVEGDLNLKSKSIPDNDSSLLSYERAMDNYAPNYDGQADHIIETTLAYEDKKKSKSGMAYKIDLHNYNSLEPLSQHQFNTVMEFKDYVSESRRKELYDKYTLEKEAANELSKKITTSSVKKLSDKELHNLYEKYAAKDMYAYSIVTTPIVIEFANRAAVEQSKLTGKFQGSEDMSIIGSFFNNNNIPSNHPAVQSLVRQLGVEHKIFAKERAKYIKRINDVTNELYKDKFGLSDNRIVRFGQQLYNSLFRNRSAVYNQLYGNLIIREVARNEDGFETTDMRLKDRLEIESMYKSGALSKAEYDFYNTFTSITKEFEGIGTDKKRKGYIPHTSMSTFEMLSTRGLLGLMVNSKSEDSAIDEVKVYFNIDGKKELIPFYQIRSIFNAEAVNKKNDINSIKEFRNLKKKAKDLLKQGKNEDGSMVEFISVNNPAALDMGPMSRFSNSRSVKAKEMPSMDLNKALTDYVHSTLFTYGNSKFQGFKKLTPLIDGVYAYSDKSGFKNASNYVKEVLKEKFIMKRDQNLFGKTGDSVVNGMVKGNLLYALGYKGMLVGKGVYAIGNVAIGKYMNIKREGGKDWAKGESRYWGVDEGLANMPQRRKRAFNILKNIGFMEISLYDDVAVEKKTGLDGMFMALALLPMKATEDWIQKAHFLGKLTDAEWDKFDDNGNYKIGTEPISEARIAELEDRVKLSHGKGFTPTDQSRIHTYALGRMFMQFSRHIPANFMERFRKEDVDIYGKKQIGSLRQFGRTATDFFSGRISLSDFREYRNSLEPHQREALDASLRGMAMIAVAGMVNANMEDTHLGNISDSVISDANIYADPERMSFKFIPPAVRSSMSVTSNLW